MRIYTRGDHCVFTLKKINFYKGIPLFDFYDHVRIYTREYHYVFERYHVKKFEKQGGVICKGGLSVGNRSDRKDDTQKSMLRGQLLHPGVCSVFHCFFFSIFRA